MTGLTLAGAGGDVAARGSTWASGTGIYHVSAAALVHVDDGSHLLGGSSLFPLLRSRLRATGS
jgi:hypothetical protein